MEEEYFKDCLKRLKQNATLVNSDPDLPNAEVYETDGNIITFVDYRGHGFWSFKKGKRDKDYMFAKSIVLFEEARA